MVLLPQQSNSILLITSKICFSSKLLSLINYLNFSVTKEIWASFTPGILETAFSIFMAQRQHSPYPYKNIFSSGFINSFAFHIFAKSLKPLLNEPYSFQDCPMPSSLIIFSLAMPSLSMIKVSGTPLTQ